MRHSDLEDTKMGLFIQEFLDVPDTECSHSNLESAVRRSKFILRNGGHRQFSQFYGRGLKDKSGLISGLPQNNIPSLHPINDGAMIDSWGDQSQRGQYREQTTFFRNCLSINFIINIFSTKCTQQSIAFGFCSSP